MFDEFLIKFAENSFIPYIEELLQFPDDNDPKKSEVEELWSNIPASGVDHQLLII